MWIIEKYVKYLIGFAILWVMLALHRSCGCAKVLGDAMNPTFLSDEFLIVDMRKKAPGDIQSKDLIWFLYKIPNEKEDGHLARVIGMHGDRVEIKDGNVFVNDLPLAEEYLKPEFLLVQDIPKVTVPRNHYYILCDNRKLPLAPDSRRLGPIPVTAVEGKVKR